MLIFQQFKPFVNTGAPAFAAGCIVSAIPDTPVRISMHLFLEASSAQCRYLLTIAVRTMNGLDDSHLALEPQPALKTAGWLIGHLVVTGDFARRLFGRTDALCPKEWRDRFNPGTAPSLRREDYPSMDALRAALLRVYEDLPLAAAAAPDSVLERENPYEPARRPFPHAGDFGAYLSAAHFAYHVGQLTAWRAAAGLPPLGPE